MGAIREVLVPDIGDYKDVPVIEVLVRAGQTVSAEESLITLESDKATMEVPAPFAGLVKDLKIKVGDKVSQGTLVLTLEAADAAGAAAVPAPAPAPAVVPAPPPPVAAAVVAAPTSAPSTAPIAAVGPIDEVAFSRAHASPSVRRFARELGVDLGQLKGSGPEGQDRQGGRAGLREAGARRVVRRRVQPQGAAFQGSTCPRGPWSTSPSSVRRKHGRSPRIQKISGPALHRNWVMIPHITQQDEADITDMEAFRKTMSDELAKSGVKITPLAILMKAVVASLKQFPEFNASISPGGDALILKQYFHIGVAVDTPEGLVVPVIRDVDKKGIVQLAKELAEISQKARDKKMGPDDMQGGTFSISSLGGIGGTHFTPIINAPEVAILGVSRSSMKPVWKDGQFVPRLMLPLSLSYDHRVIDGAKGARFITHLNAVLFDIRRVML